MQETQEKQRADGNNNNKKKMRKGACGWLRDRRIGELVLHKRRLVEVPYTTTLAHTFNTLVANNLTAVPVAAPPGRWIGAGGTRILESDPATGSPRKHYIGMVTMLDILVHIAEIDAASAAAASEDVDVPMVAADVEPDLEKKMAVAVSSVIGHSLEGLSLWTLNPGTSILDCMETFSKGVHRALVPLESHTENVFAAELVEASPGYRMLTQMDVLAFLRKHADELHDITSRSVHELGAVNEIIFAVSKHTKVIEAIKSMRTASLNAVPIVEAFEPTVDGQILQEGKGKRLIGTFSATDLRGCSVAQLQALLSVTVVEFKQRVSARSSDLDDPELSPRKLITCYHETSLNQVIEEVVDEHVHRVWVVDREGLLRGLVSLTDMLRVVREATLVSDRELREILRPNEPN